MAALTPASPAQGRNRTRVDVGQNARDAGARRRRESRAFDLPLLRRRLWPTHLSSRRETCFQCRLHFDRALHEGRAGWEIRIAEFLAGPLALILRWFGAVPASAISFLVGALLSRLGWIEAGRVSGSDPEAVFASQR